jgi:hypothetical protein
MAMSIIRWAIGCMAGVLVLILALPVACAEDMTIYAAGALKKALPDLLDAFERETGIHFTMRFGPSGLLHREIETGAVPDVFASAIATHTEALQRAHIMRHSHIFARNRLCVTARAGVPLDVPSAGHLDSTGRRIGRLHLGSLQEGGGRASWCVSGPRCQSAEIGRRRTQPDQAAERGRSSWRAWPGGPVYQLLHECRGNVEGPAGEHFEGTAAGSHGFYRIGNRGERQVG